VDENKGYEHHFLGHGRAATNTQRAKRKLHWPCCTWSTGLVKCVSLLGAYPCLNIFCMLLFIAEMEINRLKIELTMMKNNCFRKREEIEMCSRSTQCEPGNRDLPEMRLPTYCSSRLRILVYMRCWYFSTMNKFRSIYLKGLLST
jgi:hypothetical protein